MSRSSGRRALRIGSGLAMLAGLGAIVVLVAWQGAAELGRALLAAGWGIALVALAHFVAVAASGLGWRALAGAIAEGRAWVFIWARLLREAISGLLPVVQVGGDVVGARILTLHGSRPSLAGASVLVDLTLEFLTQIVFTAVGLGVLLADGGGAMAGWVAVVLALALLAAIVLLLAQRWGILLLLERLLQRVAGHFDWPALGALATLHDTAMAIYRHRRAMIGATLWHLAGWLLGAVEIWIVFLVLGADVGFAQALVIESLVQALRSAAFFVPGAYGVQEGGFMVLGLHFGLAPELALSASLLVRVRQLVLGVPAMLVWQFVEGRRLLGGGEAASEEAA